MREFECSINNEHIILKGTACVPSETGRVATVVMIHGSGALDRNGNQKGFELNVFNSIAHHLASQGIASIRYDKRGCGKSSDVFHKTGHFDLVDDVIAWVDELKNYDFVDLSQIYLLGHSEGCIIAPQVNLKRKHIAGIILLCPFSEPLDRLLEHQAKQVYSELLRDIEMSKGVKRIYKKAMLRLFGSPVSSTQKLINKVNKTSSDYCYWNFSKVAAKWFREVFTVDPIQVFNDVTSPILAIGGGKDIQCNPLDVYRIKKATPAMVEAHVIPDLTHLLRCDTEQACYSNYSALVNNDIDEIMLDIIDGWLKPRVRCKQ